MKGITQQTGFTLMEVLVAVLILSLGLLGIAGLQLQGTRHVYDAHKHSVATMQAQDIADRMRANIEGVKDKLYDGISLATIPADPGCISTGCTTAEIATYDAYLWNTNNQSLLPSGQGEVSCTDINAATATLETGSRCTIIVRWDSDRTGATGTGCDPSNGADLRCIRMTIIP